MSRAAELAGHFEDCTSLAVVCHDDPDPDCLASAYALGCIARRYGITDVVYVDGHRLSHPQNQALAAYLGLEVTGPASPAFASADLVALVDHAVPGVHDSLAPGSPVDVVIDHHEYDDPPAATFLDLRPEYGATATICFEYLRDLAIPLSVPLASALLFALHRERLDHVRHPTNHEYEAATALYPHCDARVIDHLYESAATPTIADSLATAIQNRQVSGSCLVSWAGQLSERDALPHAADYLVGLRGIESVLVLGLVDGAVHLSARSTSPAVDLGRVLPRLVGSRGDAGGHSDMAGGVVPMPASAARSGGGPATLEDLVEGLGSQFCERVRAANAASAPDPTAVL
jgi:nanoRNase/pAp phosphatase (c-di-AMP/oligoRNAs hydrolase)